MKILIDKLSLALQTYDGIFGLHEPQGGDKKSVKTLHKYSFKLQAVFNSYQFLVCRLLGKKENLIRLKNLNQIRKNHGPSLEATVN